MAKATDLESELAQVRADHAKEMRDLKVRVIDTARKYAKNHGLCDVVERALDEAGIDLEYKRVQIEMTVPVVIVAEIDATLIESATDEEKAQIILENIKLQPAPEQRGRLQTSLLRNARFVSMGDVKGAVVSVGEVASGTSIYDYNNPPPRYLCMYMGWDGRVAHFIRSGHSEYALCGIWHTNWRDYTGSTQKKNDDGSVAVCKKCLKRSENEDNL